MHDTLYILPNHINAIMDTVHVVSSKAKGAHDWLLNFLGIVVPAGISIISILFVARSAKHEMSESSKNTVKQLDNALSIAQLNINNSIKLSERQTYVDLILRNMNQWKDDLMELAAQIEKDIISFTNAEDKHKIGFKASAIYNIDKARLRLNIKKNSNKELLSTIEVLENFLKGINDHNIENPEMLYSYLGALQRKTYSVCKEVWDVIQKKCKWDEL